MCPTFAWVGHRPTVASRPQPPICQVVRLLRRFAGPYSRPRRMRARELAGTAVLTSLLGFAAPAWAQQKSVPFEGFMTDVNDMPVDGSSDLVVRIYDVAEGGTPLFEETHTGVL